jgi:hypothetical protein
LKVSGCAKSGNKKSNEKKATKIVFVMEQIFYGSTFGFFSPANYGERKKLFVACAISGKSRMFDNVMRSTDILDNFDFDENVQPGLSEEGEVVAKFFSSLEAEVAAARLRAEGIHCFLANTAAQSVLPHLQTIVRLHVRPVDSARAREILHEAAIETVTPLGSSSGRGVLVALAILVGILLAALLVRAIWHI